MRQFIRDLSIQWKIIVIIMLASSVAIIGAATAFIINEENSYRKFIIEDTSVLADIMSNNVSTALTFGDEAFASEALSELRAKPDIHIAAIYDESGGLFAHYARGRNLPPSSKLPSQLNVGQTQHFFSEGRLEYSKPINLMNERIGYLYISTSLDTMYQRLTDFIYIVITVLIFSQLITLILSFFLQRLISKPILSLAKIAQNISRQGDYSIRANKPSDDEVGVLIENFNAMVERIQERDQRLEEARNVLETQVRERTQRLQIVLDTAADGIITFDQFGMITSINQTAERMFEYSAGETTDININTLIPHAFSKEHHSIELLSPISYHPEIRRELQANRSDKSLFPCELAIGEANIKNEAVYTAIVCDITERKKIDRLKNEFISTISHELRTPLTSILGSLQLIKGGAVGELPEQANKLVDIACKNTDRLLSLINDILDFEKIKSDATCFVQKPIEITQFVIQALNEHLGYAKQHHVQYVLKQRLENTFVLADQQRLMQAFANLLSNAAKFSPAGTKVNISVCRQENGWIRILVKDHGPGIPEDFRDKIFDRFTQSDASDSRNKGGTGLGLAIAKSIVKRHNGNIDFISNKGEGTTFYIELPELKESAP